jgi:hypothetical protein
LFTYSKCFFATSCQKSPQEKQALDNAYEFVGGYPTKATIQKAYDQLDIQRASQAYLEFIPAMSLQSLLKCIVEDLWL